MKYAVRLRASYETLKTTIGDWALRCEKVLCYEHVEKRENIHCHLLLEGVYDSIDTLKRLMRTHGVDLKGAGQLSFKTKFKLSDGSSHTITDENKGRYITYMSKGKYDPMYNKGYEPSYILACKQAWTNYEHVSELQEQYNDFETHVAKALTEPRYAYLERLGPDKDFIRSQAFIFAFNASKRLVNRGMRNMWSNVYSTYCIRHELISQLNIPMV